MSSLRYDKSTQEPQAGDMLSKMMGLLLITGGLLLGYAIVSMVMELFQGSSDIVILKEFSKLPAEARTVGTPKGNIALPQVFFTICGYVVISILLSVLAGIMSVFIRWGSSLLRSDLHYLVEKMTKRMIRHMQAAAGSIRPRKSSNPPES